jgi:hypothetical protein
MENVTHSKLIPKLLALSSLCLPAKKSSFVSCKANPTTNLLLNFEVLFAALGGTRESFKIF